MKTHRRKIETEERRSNVHFRSALEASSLPRAPASPPSKRRYHYFVTLARLEFLHVSSPAASLFISYRLLLSPSSVTVMLLLVGLAFFVSMVNHLSLTSCLKPFFCWQPHKRTSLVRVMIVWASPSSLLIGGVERRDLFDVECRQCCREEEDCCQEESSVKKTVVRTSHPWSSVLFKAQERVYIHLIVGPRICCTALSVPMAQNGASHIGL